MNRARKGGHYVSQVVYQQKTNLCHSGSVGRSGGVVTLHASALVFLALLTPFKLIPQGD